MVVCAGLKWPVGTSCEIGLDEQRQAFPQLTSKATAVSPHPAKHGLRGEQKDGRNEVENHKSELCPDQKLTPDKVSRGLQRRQGLSLQTFTG